MIPPNTIGFICGDFNECIVMERYVKLFGMGMLEEEEILRMENKNYDEKNPNRVTFQNLEICQENLNPLPQK
jgi:hypothetical protein